MGWTVAGGPTRPPQGAGTGGVRGPLRAMGWTVAGGLKGTLRFACAVHEAVLPPHGGGTGTVLGAGDRAPGAAWRWATAAGETGTAGTGARAVGAPTTGLGATGGGTAGADLPVVRWTTEGLGGVALRAAGGGARGSRRSIGLYLSSKGIRGKPEIQITVPPASRASVTTLPGLARWCQVIEFVDPALSPGAGSWPASEMSISLQAR